MKVLIIEDEPMAQKALARTLTNDFPDVEIIGITSSVQESVEWLKANDPDIIFMDVELSDAICFDIFRQVDVKADVIMTTAYDNYAVKAFEAGSVDYLLKPIERKDLQRAMSRVHGTASLTRDWSSIVDAIQHQMQAQNKERASSGKERFIVRFNDKIIPVKVSDIAYFYSEDKNNYLMTKEGAVYVADASLDDIAEELDHSCFFKISRNCIVSSSAINSITKQIGGRLRISVLPHAPFEMMVSRSRCDDFLDWLEK